MHGAPVSPGMVRCTGDRRRERAFRWRCTNLYSIDLKKVVIPVKVVSAGRKRERGIHRFPNTLKRLFSPFRGNDKISHILTFYGLIILGVDRDTTVILHTISG